MRSRQLGLSGGLVATILLIVAGVFVAAQVVTRVLSASRVDTRVQAQLAAASLALVQFVAASERLPCPANPALDTGDEVLPAPNAATCSFPDGTIPWKTIGLARAESIDPWGQKVSYRVYTGAAGSLTQVGGASMVQCDSVDSAPSGTTTLAGSAGGLCQPQTKVTLRSTPPGSYTTAGSFLYGKGFTVNDFGTTRSGVAFVLVSHGPSGLGGYTSSGTRRDLPISDELANTTAAGATNATLCPAVPCFVVKASSASGTDPASAGHFDDLVAYRTVEDLTRAAGVYARDWPEEGAAISQVFTQAAVEAAVGSSITPGASVGQVTVTFTGVVATGLDSGGSTTNIGFDVIGGNGGLGVAGGGSALLESAFSESLRLQFEEPGSKFAFTLNDFGTYSNREEIAELRFYLSGVQVGATKFAHGCNIDGGLASFSIDMGTRFDRVDLIAHEAWHVPPAVYNGVSAFLVSEIRICPSTDPICVTSLAAPANNCTTVL